MLVKVCKSIVIACLAPIILSGCAGKTMIAKHNLAVETKMTNTVFLEPVESEQKIAYLQIKNTSDKPNLEIAEIIKANIEGKGYRVTNSPKEAHYMIQANILQVGATNLREVEGAMAGGYGGALGGLVAGGLTGGLINDSGKSIVAGGLIGAAAGMALDAMVKDVMYSMITDIQISERTPEGIVAHQSTQSRLSQGTSGTVNITSNQTTNWRKYQTRIISSANKVNLKFEEAAPELISGLANSISGLL